MPTPVQAPQLARALARSGRARRLQRGGRGASALRRGLRRQRPDRRDGAVCRELRRAPVRAMGRAAGRRPRHHARRGHQRSGQRWELQLKGAGPTPYSRAADGRAVLRSSIREFLCSEAMHHLGVPTTRALSLVRPGNRSCATCSTTATRGFEPGAIVCRVAPSFIRFGNFELPASRGELPLLDQLVDFTIRRDFPELLSGGEPADPVVRARMVRAGLPSGPRAWSRTGCGSASSTA